MHNFVCESICFDISNDIDRWTLLRANVKLIIKITCNPYDLNFKL